MSIQQEIIQKIKLGFSHATLTQHGLTESDFDNDHWFFQAYGENEYQFQAINCRLCGNYLKRKMEGRCVFLYFLTGVSYKIFCCCFLQIVLFIGVFFL